MKDLATAAASEAAGMNNTSSTLPLTMSGQQQETNHGGVARGALVVLEGLDRSGKTTQVKLLEQRFVELGRKVKVFRFPGMF
jgi:dTMP kinase